MLDHRKKIVAASIFVLTLALAYGHAEAEPSFDILDIRFTSGVRDLDTLDDEFVRFSDITLPFKDSHSAVVGNSTASASYLATRTDTFARFLVEAAHQADNTHNLFSLSSGLIRVVAHSDLLLTFEGEYRYLLPPNNLDASLDFSAAYFETGKNLLSVAEFASSSFGDFMGTLAAEDSVVLPAGSEYVLQYRMQIDSIGFGNGALGTGSGFVDFTLQAIPEPGTLALLYVGVVALFRHRRRRRHIRPHRGNRSARRLPHQQPIMAAASN